MEFKQMSLNHNMKTVQDWNYIAFVLLFFSLQCGRAISLEVHQRTVRERVIAKNITPASETNVTSLRTGYIQHFGTEFQRNNIWNQATRRIIHAGYCTSPYKWWFECVNDLARALYMHACPEVSRTFMYTEPCPRKNWGHRTSYMYKALYAPQTDMLEPCPRNNGKYYPTDPFHPDNDPGYWRTHYWYYGTKPNTVYDFQGTWKKEKSKSKWMRTHSCVKAKPVPLIKVVGYGLGWIYMKWPIPRENCITDIRYTIKYYVKGFRGFTAPTESFGSHMITAHYYSFNKFHPCPQYPNYYCMILSENIFAYRLHTIEITYERFAAHTRDDYAGVRTLKFTPDDKLMSVNFCPEILFWNSLWFLIMLILLLLTLMMIAAILLAILMSKKKANKLKEDLAKSKFHEEEPIPRTSRFGVMWERLRNFFKELCPRPQPPPPPPPPPRRKPKKPKKKKKKQKKQKTKTIVKRRIPVPPIQPPKKKERSPRTVEKRQTEAIETKRAISGVGGVSGRRRR